MWRTESVMWKIIAGGKTSYGEIGSILFKIHPFCTHEGGGLSGTEGKIKSVCKGAAVTKGLAIQGSSVGNARAVIEKWV